MERRLVERERERRREQREEDERKRQLATGGAISSMRIANQTPAHASTLASVPVSAPVHTYAYSGNGGATTGVNHHPNPYSSLYHPPTTHSPARAPGQAYVSVPAPLVLVPSPLPASSSLSTASPSAYLAASAPAPATSVAAAALVPGPLFVAMPPPPVVGSAISASPSPYNAYSPRNTHSTHSTHATCSMPRDSLSYPSDAYSGASVNANAYSGAAATGAHDPTLHSAPVGASSSPGSQTAGCDSGTDASGHSDGRRGDGSSDAGGSGNEDSSAGRYRDVRRAMAAIVNDGKARSTSSDMQYPGFSSSALSVGSDVDGNGSGDGGSTGARMDRGSSLKAAKIPLLYSSNASALSSIAHTNTLATRAFQQSILHPSQRGVFEYEGERRVYNHYHGVNASSAGDDGSDGGSGKQGTFSGVRRDLAGKAHLADVIRNKRELTDCVSQLKSSILQLQHMERMSKR